jgi:hypothetical protein
MIKRRSARKLIRKAPMTDRNVRRLIARKKNNTIIKTYRRHLKI